MNETRRIFLKSSNIIVYGLFAGIVLYLFLLSLFGTCVEAYTDEHIFFLKDFPLILLSGLCFLVVLMTAGQGVFYQKRMEREKMAKDVFSNKRAGAGKWLLPVVTACWFLLLIFWIWKTLLPPMHDQYFVFYGAKEFLEGNYTRWQPGGYLHMYPFQNTLVLFYAIFHLIFGEQAVLAVELFNLIPA